MKIALLKADYVNDDLVSLHGDLDGMFHQFLSKVMTVDLTVYEVRYDEYPDLSEAYDAYIISGSRFSVNDSYPWVSRLMNLIHAAADSVPIIGFCFGHQAIAKSLGGRVEPRLVPNIGARRIKMLSQPAWASLETDIPRVLFNHSEQVTEISDGATIIAGDTICPTQIIEFGPRLLGIQAHPEYTAAYQDALMSLNVQVTPEALAEARRRTRDAQLTGQMLGTWVRNFIMYARANNPVKETI